MCIDCACIDCACMHRREEPRSRGQGRQRRAPQELQAHRKGGEPSVLHDEQRHWHQAADRSHLHVRKTCATAGLQVLYPQKTDAAFATAATVPTCCCSRHVVLSACPIPAVNSRAISASKAHIVKHGRLVDAKQLLGLTKSVRNKAVGSLRFRRCEPYPPRANIRTGVSLRCLGLNTSKKVKLELSHDDCAPCTCC